MRQKGCSLPEQGVGSSGKRPYAGYIFHYKLLPTTELCSVRQDGHKPKARRVMWKGPPANVHHFLPHPFLLHRGSPASELSGMNLTAALLPALLLDFLSLQQWEGSREPRKNVFSLPSLEILWRKLVSRPHQCYRNSHKTLSQSTDMKPSLLSPGLRDFPVKEVISREGSQVFMWNEGGRHRKRCHEKWPQLRKR